MAVGHLRLAGLCLGVMEEEGMEIKSAYYRDPKRDQEARRVLDTIRQPGGEPDVRMDVPLIAKLGMESAIHQTIATELEHEMVRIVKLAQEVIVYDTSAAEAMYFAVAKMAEAQALINADSIKTAIAERDAKRTTAFGDYWRSNQGHVSRY